MEGGGVNSSNGSFGSLEMECNGIRNQKPEVREWNLILNIKHLAQLRNGIIISSCCSFNYGMKSNFLIFIKKIWMSLIVNIVRPFGPKNIVS